MMEVFDSAGRILNREAYYKKIIAEWTAYPSVGHPPSWIASSAALRHLNEVAGRMKK